jgi:hypothetical protein
MDKVLVEFDPFEVRCLRPGGLVERLSWTELRAVLLETNASGPWGVDVYWVLVGERGGCVVPLDAAGGEGLLEHLQKLPGFDNESVIQAMACCEVNRFVCWERDRPA